MQVLIYAIILLAIACGLLLPFTPWRLIERNPASERRSRERRLSEWTEW